MAGGSSSPLAIAGAVGLSFGLWSCVFLLTAYLQPRRSYGWNTRTVACIHGIVISAMTLVFGIWCNPSPFDDTGVESNFYEVLVQIICLGYFFFDTIWGVWFNVYGHENYIYAIHHIVSMAGMMTSLYQGVCGTEINVTIFLAEVTNPMLQFRWFMRELAFKRNNVWYELNDFLFIATYLVMRVGLAPYLAYNEIWHPRPSNVVKFFALLFIVMNVILSVGIAQYAYRKYKRIYWDWKLGDMHGGRQKSKSGNSNDRLRNSNTTFGL